MSGIGYRQICAHLRGEMTLAAAAAEMKTETHRLARMQDTWFRRDDARINWFDADASDLCARAMAVRACYQESRDALKTERRARAEL